MNPPAPDIKLSLPARPESVAVVRQALAGLADALDLDGELLADMKTAVSEACTNVVVHAYDSDGPLAVDMSADDVAITVAVSDRGCGIQPQPQGATDKRKVGGLGLPLIAALSDSYELRGDAVGTAMRMTFLLARQDDNGALVHSN